MRTACVFACVSLRQIIDGEGSDAKKDGTIDVIWTYDITWQPSNIKWASRWDIYLNMNHRYDDEVHWPVD